MDPTQEGFESLGFLDICAKSIKIIFSYKKIFLQVALTLILPLSIIFIYFSMISTRLATTSIVKTEAIFDVLCFEYIKYWVIDATYFTLLVNLSLLSFSTIVYIVRTIYFNNPTSYKMVMGFVPRVWIALLTTLLCNFAIFIIYTIVAFLALDTFLSQYPENDTKLKNMAISAIYVLYFLGFGYICVIWKLSSLVSVLEDTFGFRAIAKSKTLIKGKMGIAGAIFLEVNLCLACISLLLDRFVEFEGSIGMIWKIGCGCLIFLLQYLVFLFGLVVQTIIYFVDESSIYYSRPIQIDVCKSGYVHLGSIDVRF